MTVEAILDPATYRILEDGPNRFVVVHDEWEECPVFETEQQAQAHIAWLTDTRASPAQEEKAGT